MRKFMEVNNYNISKQKNKKQKKNNEKNFEQTR